MRVLLLMILAVFSLSVSAQTITATGNVKDATGDPIIGASIVEKGNTSNGTITNLDGDFSLKVPANATLIVSYIGMKTQEIAIKGKNKIDVTLSDDTKALDEVVVIGYGTAKRKDITGSVATVSSEVLSAVPVASATEALQGKMAGVQITTTEGSPDAEMKIRVRGGSITGDNTPLFIVDGFPVESISDIPASDIEDMTVLKDASSTAIYGSRGANGVILVTTKSGKEGKLSVSYNTYYSWKKMAKTLETLSATDYVKWQREYALLRGNESKFTSLFGNWQDADLYENAPTNDWQDQVFGRTGNTFNHSLTISGGSDKTKFNMGYAHMNDKAIMLGSSFRRDNLSLKLNHKVNDKVSLDFSMRYANTTVNGAGANESKSEVSSADSRMKNVMIYPMFNFPDLSDSYDPDFQLTNPITSVYDTDRKQNRQTFNMNGSFSWEIFKNFKFKTEFGLDWYYNTDKKYYGPSTYNARTNSSDTEGVHPMAYFADTQRKTFRNTNTVNYNFKDIIKNKDHNLNVLVGEETINKKSSLNDDRLSFFPVSFTASQAWALSSQGTPYSVDKYTNADDNLLSYFGRVNYDFQSKYLISGTFRADGSSKFSKGNRWGYFPSAAVAWRISSEKFMEKTQNWLDDLKIRASWGQTGNQEISNIARYTIYVPNYGVTESGGQSYGTSYDIAGTNGGSILQSGFKRNQIGNDDIKWETTTQTNLGLDFSFFNQSLYGSFDWYWKKTTDILVQMAGIAAMGEGSSQWINAGEMENKGFELNLGYRNTTAFGLKYDLNANISAYRNKITALPATVAANGTFGGNGVESVIGHPNGSQVGYVADGIFKSQEEIDNHATQEGAGLGRIRWRDLDGNGVINEKDQQWIYDPTPAFSYGLNVYLEYKNFDLTMFWQGVQGVDVISDLKKETDLWSGLNIGFLNKGKRVLEAWSPTNPDSDIPALSRDDVNNEKRVSTYFVENGSFLKLRNIQLGYNVPQAWAQKMKMERLRLYVSAQNVLTIKSKEFTGVDPENPNYGYPIPLNVTFGVNVSF